MTDKIKAVTRETTVHLQEVLDELRDLRLIAQAQKRVLDRLLIMEPTIAKAVKKEMKHEGIRN